MILKRIFTFVYHRYLIFRNPALCAKEVGVNLKGDVFIYGAKPDMFGSEPWLITLGHSVHITGECQFINHDGSILILRKKVSDL